MFAIGHSRRPANAEAYRSPAKIEPQVVGGRLPFQRRS